MILLIDIGNTSVVVGTSENNNVKYITHMHTEKLKSDDEYAEKLLRTFKLNDLETTAVQNAVISSVVPELTFTFSSAIKKAFNVESLFVGEENHGKLKCDVIPIKYIGADLICGCVGAIEKYPLPAIVIDMGTATKLLAIDKDGFFLGCSIAPGIRISLNALTEKASLLPEISLAKPVKVIGTDTIECMQSGSVYGSAAMIDGLIERIKEECGFENASLIATGGYVKYILSACNTKPVLDENLILEGLNAIFAFSQRPQEES